jgi:putative endonuclease
MSFYIYIIQSQVDKSYYIGYTKNLDRRLSKHNSAKSGYTARKQPWTLIYFETFKEKSAAIKREQFLKKQKNRDFILRLINDRSG